ncbi:MAG: hypothetical protein KC776_34465 [Myxococcales bacterium]|nr:hypothetical protein [Myxococcales bacterium]MCB9581011.1 hypothetical protein [Polyangiaceae bacterium]
MPDLDRVIGSALVKNAAVQFVNAALSNAVVRQRLDDLATAWLAASGAAELDDNTEAPAVLPFPGGNVQVPAK